MPAATTEASKPKRIIDIVDRAIFKYLPFVGSDAEPYDTNTSNAEVVRDQTTFFVMPRRNIQASLNRGKSRNAFSRSTFFRSSPLKNAVTPLV